MVDEGLRELDYAAGPPRSGLAVAALVLGVASFLCGPFTALPAVVLGAWVCYCANRQPKRYGGKGLAILGMMLGAVGCLVIAILLPSLGRARELGGRSTCPANLTGLVKAMRVYATDCGGYFPAVAPLAVAGEYTVATGLAGTETTAPDALNAMQPKAGSLGPAGVVGNPLACMWILVLTNQVAPKGFVCKSDASITGSAPLMDGAHFRYTFENPHQVSYSIIYPWATPSSGTTPGTVGAWWKDTMDASQPVACDMAPMNGTGKPVRVTNPAVTPTDKKTWNSGNHNGEGQNVVYADCHTEWQVNPVCGASLPTGADNIFTTNQTGPGTGGDGLSANGRIVPPRWMPPSTAPAAAPQCDAIMVPVRNLNTGGF